MRMQSIWNGTWMLTAAVFATTVHGQDLDLVGDLHEPVAEHVDQDELVALVSAGEDLAAFELAFETGDELFDVVFNALDGVGANVGNGLRFSRTPRADLTGPGEWATHTPMRATGPNGDACVNCHRFPPTGAGPSSANVARDPFHSGNPGQFIFRNTPHLMGSGAVQRLAEEMTSALHGRRAVAVDAACASGQPATMELEAKGIAFGFLTATPTFSAQGCDATVDTAAVTGVDADLIIRPFQWKGSFASLRDFNRDAAHNELGLQAVELVGDNVDGDSDGIVDELTIGDQTALAIYVAGQPRPTTRTELAGLGLIEPIPEDEVRAIKRGFEVFREQGCADCHVPSINVDTPVFSEPSQHAAFRDSDFPGGQDPIAEGVDPALAVTFDLTEDLPDNQVLLPDGRVFQLGTLQADRDGRGIVALFGDLRRHDMGPDLAESIDETGTGASVFLTENLWGVGSTAPYLHDGRATTLTEAILWHGGDAEAARDNFVASGPEDQANVIAFLSDLVLFKEEEEEE